MDKAADGRWIKTEATYTDTLSPGQSGIIIAKNETKLLTIETTEYAVPCIIQTNYGVFTVNLAVVR
jgi:hypothetical protein